MNQRFKSFLAVISATLFWLILPTFPSLALTTLSSQDGSSYQTALAALAKPSLDQTISSIEADLDSFWAGLFANENLPYYSPNTVQSYRGSLNTPCGLMGANNAEYCTWTDNGQRYHGIYYDEDFMRTLENKYGDVAVAAIFAHEWGHLVQNLLGYFMDTQTVLKELQADCLSGVYLSAAKQKGEYSMGDLNDVATLLYNLGDNLPLIHPDAHGSPEMRREAFTMGFQKGLAGCQLGDIVALINQVGTTPNPTPPNPEPNALDVRAFDRDHNCRLDDGEFFDAVDQWLSSGINDGLFFGTVDAWIGQTNLCAALTFSHQLTLSLSMPPNRDLAIFEAKGLPVESMRVEVYDLNGRPMILQQTNNNSLRWDLRDSSGLRVANGVYLYRVRMQKMDGSIQTTDIERLVVLR
ncbi:neutral zinc metallopeptidase [Candidatus Acetothermia bacterium]|nr:neutral zinc metallopeptidase [Candidatus Acetothermia bacterium]